MNITLSARWNRPPLGIVRVERALFAELSKLYGEKIKPCIWSEVKGQFIEYDKDSENYSNESVLPKDAVPVTVVKKHLPSMYPLLSRRKALEAIAQGFLSLTPNIFFPYINGLLYWLKPKVITLLNKITFIKSIIFEKNSSFNNPNVLQTKIDYPNTIFKEGDILLSLGNDWDFEYYKSFYYLRKEFRVRIVGCCYDLIPVLFPQFAASKMIAAKFESYFLDVADGADLILCISKQSERDLVEMLERMGGALPPRFIFELGDNVPDAKGQEVSEELRQLCSNPFILFVSTIESRKNHEILYRAYKILAEQNKLDQLPIILFVGMPGWGVSDLINEIENDKFINQKIVFLNHVNDAELVFLYEKTLFCVYPSLYEGWGLPVGEALAMGKAVISSDKGALPEVGGDLVIYADPTDAKNWADEIYKMSTNKKLIKSMEERVKKDYKIRSWTDAAKSVKDQLDAL